MKTFNYFLSIVFRPVFLLGMFIVLGALSLLSMVSSGGKGEQGPEAGGWVEDFNLVSRVYADNPHESTTGECACEGAGGGGCSSCEGSY